MSYFLRFESSWALNAGPALPKSACLSSNSDFMTIIPNTALVQISSKNLLARSHMILQEFSYIFTKILIDLVDLAVCTILKEVLAKSCYILMGILTGDGADMACTISLILGTK